MNQDLLSSYLRAALRTSGGEAPTDAPLGPAEPDPLPADLYSISEAAELLHLAKCTVYRWFRRGWVTFYGHPGAYRVSLKQLLPPVRRAPSRLPQPRRATETGVAREAHL